MKNLLIGILLSASVVVCMAAAPWDKAAVSGIRYFNVVATDAGDTEIIPAIAGKNIRILSCSIVSHSATATDLTVMSGSEELWGTAANGQPFDMTAISGISGISFNGNTPWVETSTENQSVFVRLSAGSEVSVQGAYVEVR